MLGFEPRVTFLFRPKVFVIGGGRGDVLGLVDDHHDCGESVGAMPWPLIVCWRNLTEEARSQNWVVM
jgi:hypothetical protein